MYLQWMTEIRYTDGHYWLGPYLMVETLPVHNHQSTIGGEQLVRVGLGRGKLPAAMK